MQSQLSICERKVYDGRPSLKHKLPMLEQVVTEVPCYRCIENLNDYCNPQFCPKLTAWLQQQEAL